MATSKRCVRFLSLFFILKNLWYKNMLFISCLYLGRIIFYQQTTKVSRTTEVYEYFDSNTVMFVFICPCCTVEATLSGHSQKAEKVSLRGGGRLRERVLVRREFKRCFLKACAVVSRAVRLGDWRECPLGEHWLFVCLSFCLFVYLFAYSFEGLQSGPHWLNCPRKLSLQPAWNSKTLVLGL